MNKMNRVANCLVACVTLIGLLFFLSDVALADGDAGTIGGIADNIRKSMAGLGKLIVSGSLIAGMGFAVGAILKFKQHKDNPTQIPVGTPIALIFIAAALIFMPSLFGSLGKTVFGDTPKQGNIEGTAGGFITSN